MAARGRGAQVHPGVWVGDQEFAQDADRLAQYNVRFVLVVAAGMPAFHPDRFEYRHKPLLDVPEEDLLGVVKGCCGFIERARQDGAGVLVHCVAGESRSVAVACAYIMAKDKVGYDEAVETVRARLPKANPNEGFVKQLRVLESRLRVVWRKEQEKKRAKEAAEEQARAEQERKKEAEERKEAEEAEEKIERETEEKEEKIRREKEAAEAEAERKGKEESENAISTGEGIGLDDGASVGGAPAQEAAQCDEGGPSAAGRGSDEDTALLDGAGAAKSVHHLAQPHEFFRCRACRQPLFVDSDIMERHEGAGAFRNKGFRGKPGQRTEAHCTSYFVDRMEWMSAPPMHGLSEVEGKLHCPKCAARIGSWHWDGAQCSCGRWCTPSIQILRGRVDHPIAVPAPAMPISSHSVPR